MPNVPSNTDAPKPRRLDFTPKPKPTQLNEVDAARIKRRQKPEKFRVAPRKRTRLPGRARIEVEYDPDDVRWSGALECNGIRVEAKSGGVMMLLGELDSLWRDENEKRELVSAEAP